MSDKVCPYCHGEGFLTVESDGGGPAYACPDCAEYMDDDEDAEIAEEFQGCRAAIKMPPRFISYLH